VTLGINPPRAPQLNRYARKILKIITAFICIIAISTPIYSFGDESQYCSDENYKKISILYENNNTETANIVFQILSCEGHISKKSKRDQLNALVAGYMRKNPKLIHNLLTSANSANNNDAPQIFLDGLWICSTSDCKNKLRERPFKLPIEMVNKLIAEIPPDPYSIPINDPATLDFLWGYFLGSGDIKIVERVYMLLSDNWEAMNSKEPMGVNKRLTLSAARWSLVSIASQQELVKKLLENKKSAIAQELLKEVREN